MSTCPHAFEIGTHNAHDAYTTEHARYRPTHMPPSPTTNHQPRTTNGKLSLREVGGLLYVSTYPFFILWSPPLASLPHGLQIDNSSLLAFSVVERIKTAGSQCAVGNVGKMADPMTIYPLPHRENPKQFGQNERGRQKATRTTRV